MVQMMSHNDVEVAVHVLRAAVQKVVLVRHDAVCLKTKNGRKHVRSAPYRPVLSASRTGQRPTAVCAHADPAQNGGNGGNRG